MNAKPDSYGRDAIRPYQIPLKGWGEFSGAGSEQVKIR